MKTENYWNGYESMKKRIEKTCPYNCRDEFNKKYKPGRSFPATMGHNEIEFARGEFAALADCFYE